MKRAFCLILILYANRLNAQLKVEQLTNDSLRKAFIAQQTGKRFDEIRFLTGRELTDLKTKDVAGSELDTIPHVNSVVTDFNGDGRKDLIINFAIKPEGRKHFDGFYIYGFVSNNSGGYAVNDIWKEYEYTLGYINKFIPQMNCFVLSRHEFELREEKIKYDTLEYFQGEFINVANQCNYGFSKLLYYTSSNWITTPLTSITIFSDGNVYKEFDEGTYFATYKGVLRKSFFDSLTALFCKVNPVQLNDRYEMENISDAGTSHLRIYYGNQFKRIDDYGHCGNFGLWALYKMIWRINKEVEWKLLTEKRDQYRLKRMPGDN